MNEIQDLNEMALKFSRYIDESYEDDYNSEELVDRRRLDKLAEEVGEVISAYGSYVGENPRKGKTKSRYHVEEEILDVIAGGIFAYVHMKRNSPDHNVMAELSLHMKKLMKRAGIHPLQVGAAEPVGQIDPEKNLISHLIRSDGSPRTVCCEKSKEELAKEVGEIGFLVTNNLRLVTCSEFDFLHPHVKMPVRRSVLEPEVTCGLRNLNYPEMVCTYKPHSVNSMHSWQKEIADPITRDFIEGEKEITEPTALELLLETRGYERCTPELLKKYPHLCLREPMSLRRFTPDGSHWHRTVDLAPNVPIVSATVAMDDEDIRTMKPSQLWERSKNRKDKK
jgi:NTP pyrophosphatase (non-canonical NTP hydrolase)